MLLGEQGKLFLESIETKRSEAGTELLKSFG